MKHTIDQTKSGYIPRDKLEEFLKKAFPNQQELGIKVSALLMRLGNYWLKHDFKYTNYRWSFNIPEGTDLTQLKEDIE